MGYYCTVPQCTSLAGKTKNVKFHRFPRDVLMADKWNMILKRGKPYTKYSKVCSLHFTQADYNVTTMGQWKTLSKDAVPSLNLPKLNPDGTVMVIRKSRAVKYREIKKEDCTGEKCDKWSLGAPSHTPLSACNTPDTHMACQDTQDALVYRYSQMNPLPMSPLPTHLPHPATQKPKKQDAIMQTDPVLSEDDDSQPNNSYSEVSDKSYEVDYQNYEARDYTKQTDSKADFKQDYLPQTNEEYNKEAEKYALERKSHNGFEKSMEFQKQEVYQKESYKEESYQKIPELYGFEKEYQNHRTDVYYQNGYSDSVELLRNQQHNLQMLQEQHRITENQNFFNENHIKQEIDINVEEDKFLYDRNKEQLDVNSIYNNRRLLEQQRLLEQMQQQVKQEPDASNGSEGVQQPQGSPYYPPHGHAHPHSHPHSSGPGYLEPPPRPGPELLIAKQNALAAHTQLWQNTMKRPFFYSETPHYNSSQLIHRYEDLQRILQ